MVINGKRGSTHPENKVTQFRFLKNIIVLKIKVSPHQESAFCKYTRNCRWVAHILPLTTLGRGSVLNWEISKF